MTVTELQPTIQPASTTGVPSADYLPLRDLVAERLAASDDPDPGAVVAPLLEELPEDLLRLAAQKGLWALAGEVTRSRRAHAPKGDAPVSARWNGAAQAAAAHPDVFAERVFTGERWVLLGDCVKDDLVHAAEHVRGQARGLLGAADRYERLSKKLKRNQVVRALEAEQVAEIFYA